jgi:methionyl-tRNA formyltransferase
MKIFFIGNVVSSYLALDRLIAIKADIVGVATKAASPFNTDHTDLTPLCTDNDIPYKLVNDINHPNNVAFIRNLKPDVIYCIGWSNLIKEEILNLPSIGVVGFHPAALPYNRGRHPIIWALALGLKKTASTFFFMDLQADTGDIISQKGITITNEDNAASLYDKIMVSALNQVEEITFQIQTNTLIRTPQDTKLGNVWRKRGKADGEIDFRMNSISIYNLVRALTKPYVGAHIVFDAKDVIVWNTAIDFCDNDNIEPGKVLSVENNTVKVKTADGAILITKHEFDNLPTVGSYL